MRPLHLHRKGYRCRTTAAESDSTRHSGAKCSRCVGLPSTFCAPMSLGNERQHASA